MQVNVRARVQAHPSRRLLLDRVLHHLPPPLVEVVEHSSEPPDPWAGYKLCLTDPPECSHLLIAQDDVIPAPGFWEAVLRIADAQPDNPVCLWMGGAPANAAARARMAYGKQPYVPLGPSPYVPLVCVLWPALHVGRIAAWAKTARNLTRADDGNIARWMKLTRTEFVVAVPSIVEHDDFTPTVKGGRRETQGRDRSRVAALLANDASQYDW